MRAPCFNAGLEPRVEPYALAPEIVHLLATLSTHTTITGVAPAMRRVLPRTDRGPPATEVAAPVLGDGPFCSDLLSQFDEHAKRLEARARQRRSVVAMRSTVLDNEGREEAGEHSLLGVRQPTDEFQGDVNLRTLRALLKMIDDRGFERCAAPIFALA